MSRCELGIVIQAPTGREMILRWENDEGSPSAQWLVPLAEVLECSVDYLLTGAESPYTGRHERHQAQATGRPL